jgi:hypothetical protein
VRKTLLRALAVAAVLALGGAATALGLRIEFGNIVINADGGFSPTTLSKKELTPITIQGHGKISTLDGTLPPVLQHIIFWFDKHGAVETRGLPICTPAKLKATTTAQARHLCPGAIVGTGFGTAIVQFPESAPIKASSPITIFNGARKHGNPTVLAHAHLTIPAPTTFVVPIEIQRVNDGRYGYKTDATIPKIAGGAGVPIYGRLSIGRKWTYKGHKMSYLNAYCPDGHLQAKGQFRFKDSTLMEGTFVKACKGR